MVEMPLLFFFKKKNKVTQTMKNPSMATTMMGKMMTVTVTARILRT